MKKLATLLTILMLFAFTQVAWGQTTVFEDNFSTNTSTSWTTSGQIGTSAWSVTRSGADWGARRNTSPEQLELTNDASGTTNNNGWVFAYTSTSSFSSPYTTTLSSNPGLVTWTFNMRQIRTDPAGFASGSYGVAFVLAGTSTNVNNTGNGYAVVLGQSGTTDPIRLAKYNNGLSGTLTNIIISNTTGLTDFGAEYLSVSVTYNPSNNQWGLFLRNDGLSAFQDPTTGTLTSQGTATDNEYTGSSLSFLGGYWQGATTANQTAFFDNVKVTVTISPVTSVTVTGTGSGTGTISWTAPSVYVNANNETIVFLKQGSPINEGTPNNNISSYTANTIFGDGTVYQNDGSAYCIYKGDGTSVNVTNIVNDQTYYALVFNTNGSSSYSSGATDFGVLPVQLTSLNAFVQNNYVNLKWTTATEVQNLGWEIERLKDSKIEKSNNWEKIGFVKGNGTTNSPNEYSFVDNSRLYGNYSYRLKQIDIDGSYEYSDIVSVNVGLKPIVFDMKNYPNPFNPETKIEFEIPNSAFVNLSVYNSLGEKIATLVDEFYEEGIYKKSFDGRNFPSGIYFAVLKADQAHVIKKMLLVK